MSLSNHTDPVCTIKITVGARIPFWKSKRIKSVSVHGRVGAGIFRLLFFLAVELSVTGYNESNVHNVTPRQEWTYQVVDQPPAWFADNMWEGWIIFVSNLASPETNLNARLPGSRPRPQYIRG